MNKRKVNIQNSLREFRLKAGLTQQQVADAIGANHVERICHWEKGRNAPGVECLMKLCQLYKTSIDQLYV
jgi:DNA-binding XRE family transcriptional regulator